MIASGSTVAVVGAGVTGLSLAFELSGRGVDVVVYDRAGIGAGASGVQPGGVRQQWGTRVNCLLARESFLFYRDVAEHLDAPHLSAPTPCGYVFLAHTPERLESLAAEVELQQEVGVPSEIVAPERLAELVPPLDISSVCGAAVCGEDGYFDHPQAIVESYAQAARRRGARIETCDVLALQHSTSGWFLEGAHGERHQADVVIVAAAHDAPALVASLGLDLPIEKEARYLFYSEPIRERLLAPLLVSAERRFATKQLANGRVLASDLSATGDPEHHSADWRNAIRRNIRGLVPLLEYVDFSVLVQGFYDVTPDNQPIIGPVPGLDNLWLAAGFSGHGFMMAPAISRLVADVLVHDASEPLLEYFAPDRFSRADLAPESHVV